jgi:hypothetical protein
MPARQRRYRDRRAIIPTRIGPAEFGTLGAMVAVRCPSDLDPVMRTL